MGLTKQLYDSYVLDGSMEINYYEKISYMRGLDKPKKNKRSLKYGGDLDLTCGKKNRRKHVVVER
tara:strand:- start:8386 stop:8580 length:195 start_codon:yes stop_codon:yes gene_type:complete